MSEKTLQNHFMLLISKLGGRLFRNNSGVAYQGETHRLKNGDILIKKPRMIRMGLATGSADTIGWLPKKITYSDVGNTVAVFCSIEYKSSRGKPTPEQIAWANTVKDAGGISLITSEIMDAETLLSVVSQP
jgi:hypothetical protein